MGKLECSRILATMWDDFIPRVDKICEFYSIKKVELAEIIGTAQSNLSTHGVHHKEAYRILVNYPDINARWLLFGEGDMITPQKDKEPQQQAAPTPDGVTMIGDEITLYRYMYEKAEAKLDLREKELVALTKEYTASITRMQMENEQLRRRLTAKPYRRDDDNDLPMAAEPIE